MANIRQSMGHVLHGGEAMCISITEISVLNLLAAVTLLQVQRVISERQSGKEKQIST